jgi:hypothetical protein
MVPPFSMVTLEPLGGIPLKSQMTPANTEPVTVTGHDTARATVEVRKLPLSRAVEPIMAFLKSVNSDIFPRN